MPTERMSSEAIQVALCADANYAPHLATTLQSIFQHNQGVELDVHVLGSGMDATARTRIETVAHAFGRSVHFHDPDIARFAHLGVHAHFSHAIYLRLLLPELFPELSRMLYLDCDLVVEAPLKELWAVDIEGAGCAAVPGTPGDSSSTRLGIDRYVNSGVLLLNLDYWRRNEIAARCIRWLEDNPELARMPDQDAINIVLNGQMVFVLEKWNLNPATSSGAQLVADNPHRILHFAGPWKPWHRYYDFRLADIYAGYRRATPWGDEYQQDEPQTSSQALLVAHQLADRERFDEAYRYFEMALRLELTRRKLDTMLQVRALLVARSLASSGQHRLACDLHRASFEQWGYPYDYQNDIYVYETVRRLAIIPPQADAPNPQPSGTSV